MMVIVGGSQVAFTDPLSPGDHVRLITATPGGGFPDRGLMSTDTIRVIIADDHALFREGTRHILAGEPDIEVVGEAANGAEAVAMVEQLQPHVAIIDISMPVLGGIEATKRIKSAYPGIAILILTSYDDDRYVFALLAAGAAGYLLKDVPPIDLVRAVRSVHVGESVLAPAIARKVWAHFAAQTGSHPTPFSSGVAPLLTNREREILRLAARGMSNSRIAAALYISLRTVQAHLTQIFNKLGVGSRTEAVIAGLKHGVIDLEDLDDQ
jgi:DNA-binding NarL/FixJ family response regulator